MQKPSEQHAAPVADRGAARPTVPLQQRLTPAEDRTRAAWGRTASTWSADLDATPWLLRIPAGSRITSTTSPLTEDHRRDRLDHATPIVRRPPQALPLVVFREFLLA